MPVLKVFKDGAWQNITSDGVSSWNDLTDKPFGDDCVIKEKGEEIFSISYDFVANDHGEILYSEDSVLEITEGETYFVDYDGTTYECIAYLAKAGSDDEPIYLPVIGNIEIVGMSGGNAEPFLIGSDIETFVYVQTEGTHDIVLYASVDGVGLKKLDKKYLPDDIGGVTSWNDLEDKPFEVPTIYYEWNYQTRYPETIELPNGTEVYVKINDEIPESSGFFRGKYISTVAAINSASGSMFLSDESVIKESDIRVISSSDGTEHGYTVGFGIAVIFSDITETDQESGATLTLSRGVWFLDPIAGSGVKPINCRVIDAPSKKINDIVIPDTIARSAQLENLITYGQEDLIPGESKLATGRLYFVYE